MSFRSRLALVSAVAVAAAVAAASVAAYLIVRGQLRDQVDAGLDERAVAIGRGPGPPDGSRLGALRGFFRDAAPPPLGGAAGYSQIVSADGESVRPPGAEIALPVTEDVLAVAAGQAPAFRADAEVEGVHVRILTLQLRPGLALVIARPLTEVDSVLGRLRWILLLVTAGGGGLAALLGLAVTRASLAPVRRLTDAIEEIAATRDLSRRAEAVGGDELGRLAASFNAMLAALEESLQAQRQLVADASHELRTPLTSLRTNLELLSREDGLAPEEQEQTLRDVLVQLEELTVLVGDVVELARDEEPEPLLEDVRLDLLVAEAVERARRHAPDMNFATELEEALVRGVPDRLHRAVANILDNAVKWSPPGGVVDVRVHDGELSVRDHGPGIAPEDLPFIFDRFYRARSARRMRGSGLGLAIVRQVADSHGGSVSAEPADGGGTIVHLRLSPNS